MQIYFINLLRSPDRAEALRTHLHDLRLSATRVEAVDGAALTVSQRMAYDPQPRLIRGAVALTDNEIACFLSHRTVWAAIAESGRPGLVLEDDVQLAPDTPALVKQAGGHVFYDLLRFDGYRRRMALPTGLRWGRRRIHQLCAGPCGSDAYALSPHAAARLLTLSERFSEPLDIFLDRFHAHGLSVFAIQPYPVRLNAVFAAQSTIGNARSLLERQARAHEGIAGLLRRRRYRAQCSAAKALVALKIGLRWPFTAARLARSAHQGHGTPRTALPAVEPS